MQNEESMLINNIIHYLCKINGFVVQLDRMADSGSAGWRFESSRGHKKTV
jgi:hypothetical protein